MSERERLYIYLEVHMNKLRMRPESIPSNKVKVAEHFFALLEDFQVQHSPFYIIKHVF